MNRPDIMTIEIVHTQLTPHEWDEGLGSDSRRERHEASTKPLRSRPIRLEYPIHGDGSIERVLNELSSDRYSGRGISVNRHKNQLTITTCLSSLRCTERLVKRLVERHKDYRVSLRRNPLQWLSQYKRAGKYRKQKQAA